MKIKQVLVSALALFGLFSALTSLVPTAPFDGAVETHSLNGCDPGLPPTMLANTPAVPLNFYSETTTIGDEERYTVSFFPPKTMAVEMRGPQGTGAVPFKPKKLHEATFSYDTSSNVMRLRLDPDVGTTGDHKDFPNIAYFGEYKPTANAKPPRLVEIPHEAVNGRRLMFVVQYKGLITAFQISDQ